MDKEGYNIKIIDHSKKEGHIEYIVSVEKGNEKFTFTERYSGLRNLSESMRKYINKATFPKFPPKKFFGGDDEKFLTKRQQELNAFFELISKDPEFSSLPPLVKFIKEKKEKEKNEKNKNEIKIKPKPEKIEENENKKNLIKYSEKDYNNIIKEYNNKFYNMKKFYEEDIQNDNNKFIKFFKSNKIKKDDSDDEIEIERGNERNFKQINQGEKTIEFIENNIKQKIGKISELYKSFNDIYDTEGIITPI